MLELYVNSDIKYEKVNDSFFNMYTYNEVVNSISLQRILEESEGVKYVNSGKIISKFDGNTIGIENISTGVKTLLNILVFPDKVFYISECGRDLKIKILGLDRGRVYSDCMFLYKNTFKPFILIYKNNKYSCDTYDNAKKYYNMYMEDYKNEG